MKTIGHKPVLVKEILASLPSRPRRLMVDATCGTGGHASAMAAKFECLICLDFDCASLKIAQKRLKKYGTRMKFVCDNFKDIKKILGRQRADFILADLGFSSWQLESNRGLAFSQNQPLDMRLDKKLKTTAADLINHLDEESLADLIYQNSDERFSRQIARAIVKKRPIFFTKQLVEIINQAIGRRYHSKISPATRTFQALRIAVNQELENLERFIQDASQGLTKNGRLAIITFHSLEEKIVRDGFKRLKKTGKFQILTPQPIGPTGQEKLRNPRSRSARLRVLEKLG
jgi:16S rRNA (cytosine1402-N4)-methyltransferase